MFTPDADLLPAPIHNLALQFKLHPWPHVLSTGQGVMFPMRANYRGSANQLGYQSAAVPASTGPLLMKRNEYELPVAKNGGCWLAGQEKRVCPVAHVCRTRSHFKDANRQPRAIFKLKFANHKGKFYRLSPQTSFQHSNFQTQVHIQCIIKVID